MPGSLIRSMKNIIFGEKTKIADITKDLDTYLSDYSGKGILPVYRQGHENDKFYEMSYTYNVVYFQLSGKPVMDEGEKKNDVYDSYTVRFPAFAEIYVPTNYIVRSPELVNGINNVSQIGDFLFMSNETDENGDGQVMNIVKKYDDTVQRSFIDRNVMSLICREEFLLASPNDELMIYNYLPSEDQALYDKMDLATRKKVYKAYFFENNHLLDDDTYLTIDDSFVAHIKNGSLTAEQTMEIYRDEAEARKIKLQLNLSVG
jgi:hypothetical protein